MNKIFLPGLICMLAAGALSGQVLKPVKWTFSAKHIEGDSYELVFRATIDDGWAIYSQHVADNGPIPTTFTFDEGSHYTRVGETKESENGKTSHDPIFEMSLTKFAGWAEFKQVVQIAGERAPVTGYLTFMCCDDEKCLPPTDVDFSFEVR